MLIHAITSLSKELTLAKQDELLPKQPDGISSSKIEDLNNKLTTFETVVLGTNITHTPAISESLEYALQLQEQKCQICGQLGHVATVCSKTSKSAFFQ